MLSKPPLWKSKHKLPFLTPSAEARHHRPNTGGVLAAASPPPHLTLNAPHPSDWPLLRQFDQNDSPSPVSRKITNQNRRLTVDVDESRAGVHDDAVRRQHWRLGLATGTRGRGEHRIKLVEEISQIMENTMGC